MATEHGTVLIVDDDEGIRNALSLLLNATGFATRGFSSGEDFLQASLPQQPSCILLDLQMPGLGGLDIQQHLRARGSEIPVIFLTANASVGVAVKAMKHGANDFIEKSDIERGELFAQLERAIAQHQKALERQSRQRQLKQRISRLTCRELEVARLAAAGKANKVIAIELGISEKTVEIHRARVMKKLELGSVAALARLAADLE